MKKKIYFFGALSLLLLLEITSCSSKEDPVTQEKEQPVSSEKIVQTVSQGESYAEKESPMLTEMVHNGALPSLSDRIPSNPRVVTAKEIGTYGGELYVSTTNPMSFNESLDLIGFEPPLWLNAVSEFEDNVFATWEHSDDYKTWTFSFRDGMKWSDGHPFGADDMIFWWEYEVNYPELTSSVYMNELKDVSVRKIDDITIEWVFNSEVFPNFEYVLATQFGYLGWFFHPAHYAKQFHPEFASEDELATLREKYEVKTNKDLYRLMVCNWSVFRKNPGMPTIAPYMITKKSDEMTEWVRNPYYWKIDTEGNQLPYIDKLIFKGVASNETLQGQIISGQSDFASWVTDLKNYTLYRENENSSQYRTLLWEDATSSAVNYYFNQTIDDPVYRDLFQKDDFRRAMSLAIDREEINKVIYFGKGIPTQFTVNKNDSIYKSTWAESYAEYDPQKASEMLDALGATVGSDGIRQYKGRKLEFLMVYWPEEPNTKTPISELVKTHWERIGVRLIMKPLDRTASGDALAKNNVHLTNWNGRALPYQWMSGGSLLLVDQISWGPAWAYWFNPDPEDETYTLREQPPIWVEDFHNLAKEIQITTDPAEREALGQEFWTVQADKVMVIGTVGYPPKPIIIRDNLQNVPEKAEWGDLWFHRYHPEVLFLED